MNDFPFVTVVQGREDLMHACAGILLVVELAGDNLVKELATRDVFKHEVEVRLITKRLSHGHNVLVLQACAHANLPLDLVDLCQSGQSTGVEIAAIHQQ